MNIETRKIMFRQLPAKWQKLIIYNISEILKPDSIVLDEEFTSYRKKIRIIQGKQFRPTDNKSVWDASNIFRVVWDQIKVFNLNSSYNFDTKFYNDYFFPAFENLSIFKIGNRCSIEKSERTHFSWKLKKIFSALDKTLFNTIENLSFSDFLQFKALNDEALSKKFSLFSGLKLNNQTLSSEEIYDEYKSLVNINEDLEFLDPLELFENLTEINLTYCNISDISALNKLNKLNKLDLSGNPIKNLHLQSVLPDLRSLYLSNTKLLEINGIRSYINIIELDLSYNEIKNIGPISELINLKVLNLQNCQISDLTPIINNRNITVLNLESNKISSFLPLSNLVKLKELNLYDCGISDFTGLEKLIRLVILDLSKNKIQFIPTLSKLKTIEIVNIYECNIDDASFLKHCCYIKNLSIRNNELSDIKFIQHFKELEWLDISNNKIKSLEGLSNSNNLKWLNCSFNLLSDLNGVENCINAIETIRFGGMNIKSLLPIMNLRNDSNIWVEYPDTTIKDKQSVDVFFNNHNSIKYDNDELRKYYKSESLSNRSLEENRAELYSEENSEQDYFDTMTDGHYGEYDDFKDGVHTIDDIDDILGH